MSEHKIVVENKMESLLALLEKLNSIIKEYEQNKSLQEFLLYAAEKKAEEIVEYEFSTSARKVKTITFLHNNEVVSSLFVCSFTGGVATCNYT